MFIVAHLRELEPMRPKPQCKEVALGPDLGGGRAGLSVLSGLLPARAPGLPVWSPWLMTFGSCSTASC